MFSLLGKIFFLRICLASPEPVYSADRIVVVLQERVITKSDVTLEQELLHRMPTKSKTLQYYRLQDPVEALIQMQLLKYFSGDIALYKPDAQALQNRYNVFRGQWSSIEEYEHFLLAFGLDEQRLLSYLRTLMIAENYLERNLGVPPDAEIDTTQEEYERWLRQARNSIPIRYIKETPNGD